MFKSASRSLLRQSILPGVRRPAHQRLLSTAPPSQKSRSWKSSAARWGLAIGGIYYYNTSNVFAEQPSLSVAIPPEAAPTDESSLQTLESLSSSRRSKVLSSAPSPEQIALPALSSPESSTATLQDAPPTTSLDDPPRTPQEYEDEAGQQGAFNEETGEINWDCPCLGGMAHGPCGEQFRAAFTCFVFSKEEPKGMDCIDKFKGMQDCFRANPDVYGAELEDDEEEGMQEGEEAVPALASVPDPSSSSSAPLASTMAPSSSSSSSSFSSADPPPPDGQNPADRTQKTKAATQQVTTDQHEIQSESEDLVPKAYHDTEISHDGK